MSDGEFLLSVERIYKQEFRNLGFIPNHRFPEYLKKGQFFRSEDGFILTGSLASEITPIYALYVYPLRRNGLSPVNSLIKLLPHKKYRVRCLLRMRGLWERKGMVFVSSHSKNWRKREIVTLEGFLPAPERKEMR